MEREERNLDGQAEKDPDEDGLRPEVAQRGKLGSESAGGGQLRKFGEVQRAGRDVEGGEAEQHARAARQCVDDKLVGRARRARAAPDFDQKKCRHEAQFPEKEPVEEIERQKYAEGRALQQEEQHPEGARTTLQPPRSEHAERRDNAGEQQQQ